MHTQGCSMSNLVLLLTGELTVFALELGCDRIYALDLKMNYIDQLLGQYLYVH